MGVRIACLCAIVLLDLFAGGVGLVVVVGAWFLDLLVCGYIVTVVWFCDCGGWCYAVVDCV